MKRFRFKLENVLQYRERIESEKQQAWERASFVVVEEEGRLRELEGSRYNLDEEGSFSGADVIMYGAFTAGLLKRIELQKASLKEAQNREEEAKIALQAAAQEAEILRKLKESKQKEYDKRLEEFEARNLDEFATLRYKRN